ncbi:MAG: ATP-binding cassette domain-containing protein, partial [Thermoactinomyces sp.]
MLLEALNLKLFIQDRLLIDAEHLHIDRKERIGLVGKNGSGKTTLLMALAGRRNPDEGTVTSNTVPELLPQLKLKETTKSGGEVTQEYIVAAISGEPELLFLDEPTTNLDTEHIEWLEKLLSNWQGAFVIVSHDRAFLDALCTEIWEIEEGKVKRYKGNYSDYIRQKELELARQKLDYEKYEQKKKQLEDALRLKQKKANRAAKTPKKVSRSESKITGAKPYFAKKQKKLQKAAKAIETRLEKLEKVEKIKEIPPIKMNLIHQETFEGRIVLRVNDVAGVVNGRVLWEETSFFVRGGDKLAVIGPNGCGKTTLLKKIVHREDGIVLSPSMKIGYFSQNLNILDNEKSILENVCSSSDHDETLIRTVLARLHFFRDDVYKRVGILSG